MELFYHLILIVYSFWIGGFATTFYNRLPNNIPIGSKHKPKCNFCQNEIPFMYFIPIIGFILSGGKCMKCNEKIPISYFLLELFIAFAIIALSMKYNIYDKRFLPVSLFSGFLILSNFIYIKHNKFHKDLLWSGVVLIVAICFYKENQDIADIITNSSIFFGVIIFIDQKRRLFSLNERIFLIIAVLQLNFIGNLIYSLIFITFYYIFLNRILIYKLLYFKKGIILTTSILSYTSLFFKNAF